MQVEPDPELVAEAKAFFELLRPMMRRTAAGQGDTLRFTLTVPTEDAMLAAWLVLKGNMRLSRKHGPLYRAVCLKRESDGYRLADWWRAKSYLQAAISERLMWDLIDLEGGTHPLLYPLPPDPPKAAADDGLDDDIPF